MNELSGAASSPEALLATLARRDAELREELRVLQEGVLARARDARRGAGGAAAAAPQDAAWQVPGDAAPAPPAWEAPADEEGAPGGTLQLRQAVEDLRAEVVRTRDTIKADAPPPPLSVGDAR